jgi:tetratricopeptide (TPR) repeat protein
VAPKKKEKSGDKSPHSKEEGGELMLARRSVWYVLAIASLAVGGCGDDQMGGHKATAEEDLFHQANMALSDGKNDEAIDLLQQSIDTKPEPYSYFLRAKILESVGREDEAIKDCETGLKLPKEVETDQASAHEDLEWLLAECKKPKGQRFKGKNALPPSGRK